jgi:transcriptional regulator with GAF, ATPase, and Fis domain
MKKSVSTDITKLPLTKAVAEAPFINEANFTDYLDRIFMDALIASNWHKATAAAKLGCDFVTICKRVRKFKRLGIIKEG